MTDKTASCNSVQLEVTKGDTILRHPSFDKENFVYLDFKFLYSGSNAATPRHSKWLVCRYIAVCRQKNPIYKYCKIF